MSDCYEIWCLLFAVLGVPLLLTAIVLGIARYCRVVRFSWEKNDEV